MTHNEPEILSAERMLSIDLNGIKLIEASAGTGKTYTIANLYLRYILEGYTPSEVLVVTFTNAATEELRGRIRARLFQALQLFEKHLDDTVITCSDQFLSELIKQWLSFEPVKQSLWFDRLQLSLRCMDEASICTIHSFCQTAMQDHALQSNQFFETNLLADDQLLWEQALKDWWRTQSYSLGPSDWWLFESSLGSIAPFIKLQREIRSSHAVKWLPIINKTLAELYLEWQALDGVVKQLSLAWQVHHDSISDILINSKALSRGAVLPYHKDNLEGFLTEIDDWLDSDQPLPIPSNAEYISATKLYENSKPKQKGKDASLDHSFFLAMDDFFRQVAQIQSTFRSVSLLKAFEYSTQNVNQQKIENRSLAYDDQLSLLLDALRKPDSGTLIADLRAHFPIAMIDEFQDTDATQYEIFERLYFSQDNLSLIMIGDPKQAIYSFRGGDIFTYMKARNAPQVSLWSLKTNWRSQQDLIKVVNCFFSYRQAPFIYDDAIKFIAAEPAPQSTAAGLSLDGTLQAPITLWHIPLSEKNKPLAKKIINKRLNEATADEILKLVSAGQKGNACFGDHLLRSGDIAVLVRTSREGDELRQVLSSKGIKSVTIGKDKIFDSEEAHALYDLLLAVGHYSDRQSLRQAIASPLLDHDYQSIATIVDDDDSWQQWISLFRDLHKLWIEKGFIAMLQPMLHRLEISQTLAKSENAERRLTNLLHLGEVLQQQSRLSAGIDSLLAWYQKQMSETDSDEAELRLESDAALVKIVTIHKSKGLEYPIVFLPFLWSCRAANYKSNDLIKFHDDQFNPVIDIGSNRREQHQCIAEKERLAEDLRLLYVALTRARSKVYLAWGDVGDAKSKGQPYQSALAYLLHSEQTPEDLTMQLPNGFLDPTIIAGDLDKLVAKSEGRIEVLSLPELAESIPNTLNNKKVVLLETAPYQAKKITAWRIASFSSLTRDVHQVSHRGSSTLGNDSIFQFPAGSYVGLLLHHLLEELDFSGNISEQCDQLIPKFAPKFGLDTPEYHKVLVHWIEQIVLTPLDNKNLSLSKLSPQKRLNELTFDFALDDLDMGALNTLLVRIAQKFGAQSDIEPITASKFCGLITGVIDLIFEFEGKFYVADYKSNHLGHSFEDYTPVALNQAIIDRRYDLQYLIYSIALHRYLATRVPDYQYETHFGGVYYLFIRAMRPEFNSAYGVFFDLPSYEHICALEALLLLPNDTGALV
jgi:exodeoxyribonuclease V beta subunit